MNSPWHLSYSFSLLMAATLILLSTSNTAESRKLLDLGASGPGLCRLADYPDICLDMAKSSKLGKGANLNELARLTVRLAMNKAKEAQATIKKFPAAPAECRDGYDSAVSNLEKAIAGVVAKSIPDVDIQLSAVITNMGDCDDAYGKASPVAKANDMIHRLADNGLAFAAKMKKQH